MHFQLKQLLDSSAVPLGIKGAGQSSSSGFLSTAFYFPEGLMETGNHNLNRGFKQLPLVPLDTIEPIAAEEKSFWLHDSLCGYTGR